jgi:S-layer family protein
MIRRALGGAIITALVASALGLAAESRTAAAAVGPVRTFATGYDNTTNDAVFDSVRGLVYATVPSTDPTYPNKVIAFDPADGSVSWSVFVGSEPDRLAISDDSTKLYVDLSGAAMVARVDLATRAVDLTFSLGNGIFGPLYVEDIEVMPTNPGVIAVSMKEPGLSPRHAGVAVFDEGVKRTNVTATHTGPNVIEFASPTTIYGYTNETTSFGFQTIEVDADGATETNVTGTSISGFYLDITYDSGRVYGANGAVVDAASGTTLGQFASETNRIRPLVGDGFAYFMNAARTAIQVFDTSTFVKAGEDIAFSPAGLRGMIFTDAGLLVWGDGFAVEPPGTIEGTVTDEVGGGRIEDLCVVAVDEHFETAAEVRTNTSGYYRLVVPSGSYLILFVECEFFDFFAEWHPNRVAFDIDGATPVVVSSGERTMVDAQLSRVFTDISRDSTFFDDIVWLRDGGITTGCGVESYCPGDNVTRAQMASFVARLWRLLGNTCPSGTIPFDDVSPSSFAYADVICIYELGITTGTSSTTYSPSATVTREQMGAFLARLWRRLGNVCPTGSTPLGDVPSTSFAKSDIECIYHLGITTGTGATTYSPSDNVTREQMAAFIARLGRLVSP